MRPLLGFSCRSAFAELLLFCIEGRRGWATVQLTPAIERMLSGAEPTPATSEETLDKSPLRHSCSEECRWLSAIAFIVHVPICGMSSSSEFLSGRARSRAAKLDGPITFGYGIDATDSARANQRRDTNICFLRRRPAVIMTMGRSSPLAWKKSPRSVVPSVVLNSTLFDFAIRSL